MLFKRKHSWKVNIKEAILLQEDLRKKIELRPSSLRLRLIAGADVGFKENKACGAVVVLTYPELRLIESVSSLRKINFPYIPGLLAFREGPVLEDCFLALKNVPQVIIFDGQGIAHQRQMGIATHLGFLLDLPTILSHPLRKGEPLVISSIPMQKR